MIISNEQDQDEEGIDEGIGEEAPPVLNIEALLSIEKLKLYIEQQSDNLMMNLKCTTCDRFPGRSDLYPCVQRDTALAWRGININTRIYL